MNKELQESRQDGIVHVQLPLFNMMKGKVAFRRVRQWIKIGCKICAGVRESDHVYEWKTWISMTQCFRLYSVSGLYIDSTKTKRTIILPSANSEILHSSTKERIIGSYRGGKQNIAA